VGLKFVIADDGLIQRDRLRQYLITAGHEVVGVADNGRIAVDLCRQYHPDAVILDIVMPVMTGDAAALVIFGEKLATYVFVASLSTQEAIVGNLRALGARVISKPYRREQLLAQIHVAMIP
jgi:DNA-binding NarL/FixJ family response regulator